ncbi:LOW QUALITY PROTEIN: hypothetical protein PHMEG_00028409 [Phytophthora megakarya]|uniref:Peptidase A2 domain-containing protein n=1 Tax=Phytophthora megakarya TaxID=4795 RepID=A0A225V4K1_9STRA|nr:LOW QUALITY PROTEIN: hypothetical protein PHMEG_00028409 [Phytophthora megakarya]
MTRLMFMMVMKLMKMRMAAIVVQRTRLKVRIRIPTKTRDWLQLLTTTNSEMLLTGRSGGATSVRKITDNSQIWSRWISTNDPRFNDNRGGRGFQRPSYGPCAACDGESHSKRFCFRRCRLYQQVRHFGKCETFDELGKILRTNVDKKNISPELQKLVFGCPPTEPGLISTGQPQSADLVIDAECLYANTGKCEWPEDNNNNTNENENEKNVDFNGECGVCLDGGKLHGINEDTTTKYVVDDDWLMSICEVGGAAPMHAKTVKLFLRERMGWWSSQRFDRRVRMRAFVRGAVNGVRTSILLDTGANVSIITTKLARRLRPDPIQEHGRQLEVQGIQEG